jgi:hypothetical protein
MAFLRQRLNRRPADPQPQLWYRAPRNDKAEGQDASPWLDILAGLVAHALTPLLAIIVGGLSWWLLSLLYRR